jgi:hypothetical protein
MARNLSACARTAAERCAYVVEVEVEVESARGRFLGEMLGANRAKKALERGVVVISRRIFQVRSESYSCSATASVVRYHGYSPFWSGGGCNFN